MIDHVLSPENGLLYLYFMYFGWAFLKIFLYAIPLVSLINLKSDNKFADKFAVFALIVPIVEIIAYFYIITIVIPRMSKRYEDTFLSARCVSSGMAAGILNIFIVTRIIDMIVNYAVMYSFGYNPYIIVLNCALITAGFLLTILHLKALHELKLGLIVGELR